MMNLETGQKFELKMTNEVDCYCLDDRQGIYRTHTGAATIGVITFSEKSNLDQFMTFPNDKYVAFETINKSRNLMIVELWNCVDSKVTVKYQIINYKEKRMLLEFMMPKQAYEAAHQMGPRLDRYVYFEWDGSNLGLVENRLVDSRRVYMHLFKKSGLE